MIYITGDTHGNFERIERFCKDNSTTKKDILIILGDAGINYRCGEYDRAKKELLQSLPITLFCIHGNHECRPQNLEEYTEKQWNGAVVYAEEEFPSILFAKDGEIYNLAGKRTLVCGGAYSVDKWYRILGGYTWFADEQPDDTVKNRVEEQLAANDWKVDAVLTHTLPYKYIPYEAFLSGIDQSTVDNSTEEWLGTVEERLDYKKWYCGHFHIKKSIDKLQIMYENIEPFEF